MNDAYRNNWQKTADSGPFAGVPEPIAELTTSLTDFVERAVGIRPDYSPETLPLVDHYALKARSELAHRSELADLAAQGLGAYFGEVVRRHLEGFWRLPSPNFLDWQMCGRAAFVAVNPIGVGYDALVGSTDHSGPSSQLKLAPEDRNAVRERLDNLPAVPEQEYFSLATRFEVLEIVMDATRVLADSRGYEEVTYEPEDYAVEMNALGM